MFEALIPQNFGSSLSEMYISYLLGKLCFYFFSKLESAESPKLCSPGEEMKMLPVEALPLIDFFLFWVFGLSFGLFVYFIKLFSIFFILASIWMNFTSF